MAITYQFSINSVTKKLEHAGLSNVIIRASFSVNAQSVGPGPESFSYSCGGYKDFSTEDLSPEEFIDFDNVTTETVVEWLLQSEGVATLDEFSYVKSSVGNIQARIEELQSRVDVSLPGNSSFNGMIGEPEPEPEEPPTDEPLVPAVSE